MDTKIILRAITALVGIPLLVLVIGLGPSWSFSLLVFLVTVGALLEFSSIALPNCLNERWLGTILGTVVALGLIVPRFRAAELWLVGFIGFVFSLYFLLGGEFTSRHQGLGWILLGSLYVGYLVPHFVLLYEFRDGKKWIFWLLLVIMVGDTAAYLVGSTIGKRKLAPRISPGKTVEGALAAIGGSLFAGVVGGRFLLPDVAWMETVFLSLGLNVLGQAGDLFESWIKRRCSVKDSGTILPGHGGLLDRIDSLIFPVVFTTYYLKLLHP